MSEAKPPKKSGGVRPRKENQAEPAVRRRRPSRRPGRQTGIAASSANGDDPHFRLADGIQFFRTEGGIAVMNTSSRQIREFPANAAYLITPFMNWTTITHALQEAFESDESISPHDATSVVCNLLEIQALISQREDWSGRRLQYPGPGWSPAETFVSRTRTTSVTQFVRPDELDSFLTSKATVYRQPSAFYEFPDAPFFELPNPLDPRLQSPAKTDFGEVLLSRRTSRRFSSAPVTQTQLSQLLFFSWGMTGQVQNQLGDYFLRKTSPSGGSLHTIEVYPIVLNVEGVEAGSYHYSVRRHGLEKISDSEPQEWISSACADQDWVTEAGVIFVCTSLLPRMSWKYDFSRAFRAVMAETGYTSQTACLVSTWLDLGCFTTLALRDDMFEHFLQLNRHKQPVLLVTGVGTREQDVLDSSRPRAETKSGPLTM
jgi:SagB-type dehydrogenase family enzyme